MIRTSDSHPLKIATLPILKGNIGITFCPGKQQSESMTGCVWERNLDKDLKSIKDWNASLVFGFPEQFEFDMLGVSKISDSFSQNDIAFVHIPFPDDTVPEGSTLDIIRGCMSLIESLLSAGKNVLFFCKGGLGRSGLVFASVMINIGDFAPEDAIRTLREIRPGAICTQEQYDFLIDNKLSA